MYRDATRYRNYIERLILEDLTGRLSDLLEATDKKLPNEEIEDYKNDVIFAQNAKSWFNRI